MLWRRITGRKKNKKKLVIGLMGAHPGAGVTHIGLLLAFYLSEQFGEETAFIECNSHRDMKSLEEIYEWSCKESNTFSFSNINFFKEVNPERIPEILCDDYENIIIDFGSDFIMNREEFLRCEKKIIIGGLAPWNQKKVTDFWDMVRKVKGNENWICLIPHADPKTLKRMQYELKRDVFSVPYNPDPIKPIKDTCRFFNELLQVGS